MYVKGLKGITFYFMIQVRNENIRSCLYGIYFTVS